MNWKFWKRKKQPSLFDLESKIASLSADVGTLKHLMPRQLQQLDQRVNSAQRALDHEGAMIKQILTFLGDVETKFETIKTILIRNDIIETEEDFDTIWDEIKGLRVRNPSETIQKGDFVRVDFEIRKKATGELVGKERRFPLRLGSGQLVIEDKIIGKTVKDRMHSFEYTYGKDSEYMPNETVLFNVWVNKVKTKIGKEAKVEHPN